MLQTSIQTNNNLASNIVNANYLQSQIRRMPSHAMIRKDNAAPILKTIEENASILDFMYQSPNGEVAEFKNKVSILKVTRFIIEHTLETLDAFFIKRQLHKFDPHVGDTACHIRGYHILLLSEELKCLWMPAYINQYLQRMRGLKRSVEKKLNEPDLLKLTGKFTLICFLQQLNAYFTMSEKLLFLVQCYILTKYNFIDDVLQVSVRLNKEKAALAMEITAKKAAKLLNKYQRSVADKSCQFVFQCNQQLNEYYSTSLLQAVKQMDDRQRSVLPDYLVTDILLVHLYKNAKPILLMLEQKNSQRCFNALGLLFEIDKDKPNEYKLCRRIDHEKLDMPCYVIHAETLYENNLLETPQAITKRILDLGIRAILMSFMATHPQYTGKKLSHLQDNPYTQLADQTLEVITLNHQFIKMKRLAHTAGCCIENKKLCYTKHIFCVSIANLLQINSNLHIKSYLDKAGSHMAD